MSRSVRSSGLPRDVYRPEISTKSALFPRFGHREIGAITASLLSSDLGLVGEPCTMRSEDVSGQKLAPEPYHDGTLATRRSMDFGRRCRRSLAREAPPTRAKR